MRRFIEEIRVKDPLVAGKIIDALETRSENKNDLVYDLDVYDESYNNNLAINGAIERYPGCCIKIFVKEERNNND